MYHGWTDQQVTPQTSTIYYDKVLKTVGGDAASKGIALFMVPGMNHCQGGAGTDTFDKMAAIESWVATGSAAEADHRITSDPRTRSTRRGRCVRSRRLRSTRARATRTTPRAFRAGRLKPARVEGTRGSDRK